MEIKWLKNELVHHTPKYIAFYEIDQSLTGQFIEEFEVYK